ncbi:hypothetical protein ACJJIC_14700 [Microbulbifer sp. ANSA002]|uniref:hypothetical protein n=1 Tax=unclassified Microbulbifer TaxID=2619833 RepID=UPI0040426B1E
MKLHKKLSVGDGNFSVVSSNFRLNLFTPGRALITVQADTPLRGLVVFRCGYNLESLTPWFVGYVEACTSVDKKQQRLFCREISAALALRLPLALRNVSCEEALQQITARSGVEFETSTGDHRYLNTPAAAFYNLASGYHAMDSLAEVYGIPRLLWQQQTDGRVYVGSWDHSYWAYRPVQIDRSWERQLTSHNGATLPALPALRPGALYNGDILTGVELAGTQMNITWSANPWAER